MLARVRDSIGKQARFLLAFTAALWLLEVVDALFLRQSLNYWGIQPRSLSGLVGILFAPVLHVNLAHLAANTLPLLVLSGFVLLRGLSEWLEVSLIVTLIGGLGVWLTGGRGTIHMGSSILIFGYLGYVLGRGFFERSLMSIVIAVVVGVLYGGMLWGVLPITAGVSWQGHLFGLLGGVLAARWSSAKSKALL